MVECRESNCLSPERPNRYSSDSGYIRTCVQKVSHSVHSFHARSLVYVRVMKRWVSFSALYATLLMVLPELAAAQRSIVVNTGIRASIPQIMTKIVSFLAVTSVMFTITLFLIGAFKMVMYGYNENKLKEGKDLMIGSLIGLCVILGSYGILRTVLYLVY